MRFGYVFAFLLVLMGCAKSPDIAGYWVSTMGGAVAQYHFTKAGAYEFDAMYDGMHAVSKGKYHFEGKQLIMEPSEANVEGSNPLVEQYRAQTMQGAKVTITMKGPDMFQLGLEQPPLILTRTRPDRD